MMDKIGVNLNFKYKGKMACLMEHFQELIELQTPSSFDFNVELDNVNVDMDLSAN